MQSDVSFADHGDCSEIRGELHMITAPALHEVLPASEPPVRLDLRGVTFIDSACLNVLLRHRARIVGAGGDLQIVDASVSVRRLLELTGLAMLLATDGDAPGSHRDAT